ncbi:MAG: rhodanese-like domain-containing protein [Aeromicrobium sp.]
MDVPTVTVDEVSDPTADGWVVVDVREPHEWADGHIEGALHIPMGDLPTRVGELDPQARTLIVCHVGARSARVTAWLHHQGHDVANLHGGMHAWEAAQRPTVR